MVSSETLDALVSEGVELELVLRLLTTVSVSGPLPPKDSSTW